VPTIWQAILLYGQANDIDLSSLRMGTSGGAAIPRSLVQAFDDKYGLRIIQGWGMTETSPVGGMAHPPAGVEPGTEEDLDWRMRSGRVTAGVEMRITDDSGAELPWDGESVGEIEVRGPWVTAAYHRDPAPEKFHDGWLRTGDIGTVDDRGYFQITDRSKDVIKSGGEWISSVELENLLAGAPGHRHPGREVDRAPAGLRGRERRDRRRPGPAGELPRRQGRPLAGARELGVHHRGTQDHGRQVRQESAPRPVRRGRAARPAPEGLSRPSAGVRRPVARCQ
jgi:acyl-CoA synthetase (AMP-forming)/AMP-acid ligase II